MNAHRIYQAVGSKYLAGTLAVFLLAACAAQGQTKKPAAPAKPAAAPAKPAARPGGAAGAAHGPTAGGAGASHGPTTTTAGHSGGGITTSGKSGGTTTTAGHATTTSGGAGARTAAPGAAARPSTAGGARPSTAGGAHPAATAGPHTASGAPPKGSTMHSTPKGDQVRTRANGKPGDVHVAGRNMDIHHGLSGSRSVRVERADHSRIVAERGGRGYVQHPYMYRGHEYGHRGLTGSTAEVTTGSMRAILITARTWRCTAPRSTIRPPFMDGPTIRGLCRLHIQWPLGAGALLPGMDSMVLTLRPIRCMRALRYG